MSRRRRTFTPDYKAQAMLEELTSVKSQAEICREQQLKPQQAVSSRSSPNFWRSRSKRPTIGSRSIIGLSAASGPSGA